VAGARAKEQVVAANLDTVFLVMGLDGNYSLRRMERMLTMAWDSGALPVVVLNKKDLCDDPESRQREVEAVAPGVSVLMLSALGDSGLEAVSSFLNEGETVALVGSSGVGKSTLINRLMGREILQTQPVREKDDRGRHTTTHRQLFKLPTGGLLIDNPGLRELQLWSSVDSLREAFEDIDVLADQCRFRDCSHRQEPGCAVTAAVEKGTLPVERLESFRSLERELQHLARKQDHGLQQEEKRKWKAIYKSMRKFYKNR
jgi:ribosome biogenesis GTPase